MDFNFYLFKEYLVQTYAEKLKRCEKVFSAVSPSYSAPQPSTPSLKKIDPLPGVVSFQRFFYYIQARSECIFFFNNSTEFLSAIFYLMYLGDPSILVKLHIFNSCIISLFMIYQVYLNSPLLMDIILLSPVKWKFGSY